MAPDGAEDDYDGLGHNPFMVRHTQVWSSLERLRAFIVQLVLGGNATIQCFNSEQSLLLETFT